MDVSRDELEDAINYRIVPDKPFPKHIDETVFLELRHLLGQHPDKVYSVWGHENPRLFMLLRLLGCDDDALYQRLDSENIGDFWLPLGPATLRQLSSYTNISEQDWRRAQFHVLSPSDQMSEQKLMSPIHFHRHILDGDAHFEEIEKLGKGGSAEVARVRYKLSPKEFACKRIRRAAEVKLQRKQLVEFVAEVTVLKRVSHHHLVSLVASFTDLASFSLILNPVAKDVLKSMLERQAREQPLSDYDITTLRRSFGCLATALAYLHAENIRHKDIKPGNILLSNGHVYLCDFGISRDFAKLEHSTTEDEVLKLTPRYCAPEVFGREPRNTKSDVWSLGCVFLEIISVVKGYTMDELNKFLLGASDDIGNWGLWCALDAMASWLEEIRSEKNDSADDIPLGWITTMIRLDKEDRISASELVEMITKASNELESPDVYIGACCTRNDSIFLPDTVDSPTLDTPAFQGLGISSPAPSSSGNRLSIPHRKSDTSSMSRPRNTLSSRQRYSEDRSVSPHTHDLGPKDSTETVLSSRDPSIRNTLQQTSSSADSRRASSPFSPTRPGSEAASLPNTRTRSSVAPPAAINVKCSCAVQPQERHILNLPYTYTAETMPVDQNIRTIQTCPKCEVGEDRIQVYERLPRSTGASNNSALPMLWWLTRRLVISYCSGEPKRRHCSALWLPLADIKTELRETSVTIRWSDCSQMTERTGGNYSTHYDWIYNPNIANNALTIRFNTLDDARRLIDTVKYPYEDSETISNCRKIIVSANTELNLFDIGRPGVRNYRAATLTFTKDSLSISKLFMVWPEADLDIHIRDSFDDRSAAEPGYEMIVEMHNVTTPTYLSDIRNEPAADETKVAHFSEARKVKTSLAVAFQIGIPHGLPKPPAGVIEMLQGLTGWTLCYFAIVDKFKSKKQRLGSKKYGRADVMLWEREVDDRTTGIKRRGARVTFRLHKEDFLWVSGYITKSTTISTSTGNDATISVSRKTGGQLLHFSEMVAIASEKANPSRTSHLKGGSDTHEGLSDLVLTFETEQYRLAFVNLVTRFKVEAAASAPLSRTATSADSMRRMNSAASNDLHTSPPMR